MKNRLDFVDISKAIGLFLVVLSHSVYPNVMFFSSFLIPVFFVLSGFTMSEYSIMKKAKRLLLPYLLFNLFFIVTMICTKLKDLTYLDYLGCLYSRYSVYPLFLSENIYLMNLGNSPLWFLPAMFSSFCLLIPYIKYSKFNFVWLLIYISITYIFSSLPILLPWSLDTAFLLSIFIFVGMLVKRFSLLNLKFIYLIIIYAIVAYLCGYINISVRIYGSSLILLLIGGTIGSLLVMKISMYIEKTKLKYPLTIIGQNSLTIFAIQMPLLYIGKKVSLIIGFVDNIFMTVIIQLLFTFVLGLFVSIMLHKLFPKIF